MAEKIIWIRKGECNNCGDCCSNRTLLTEKDRKQFLDAFKKLAKEKPKYEKIAFHMSQDFEENSFKQCKALEKRKGGIFFCRKYEERPKFCKDFPGHPDDIANLKNCSFYFIKEVKKN